MVSPGHEFQNGMPSSTMPSSSASASSFPEARFEPDFLTDLNEVDFLTAFANDPQAGINDYGAGRRSAAINSDHKPSGRNWATRGNLKYLLSALHKSSLCSNSIDEPGIMETKRSYSADNQP